MGDFKIGNLPLDSSFFGTSEIEKIYFGTNLVWEKAAPTPTVNYFGIQNLGSEAFDFSIRTSDATHNPDLKYSLDNGATWTSYTAQPSGSEEAISLSPNATIYWKGNNRDGLNIGTNKYVTMLFGGQTVKIFGNIMTLIDETGATTAVPNLYCFYSLFLCANSHMTIDNDLFANITSLQQNCFYNFFNSSVSYNYFDNNFTLTIDVSSTTLKQIPNGAFKSFTNLVFGSYTIDVSSAAAIYPSSLNLGTLNANDTTSVRTIIFGKQLSYLAASWLSTPIKGFKLVFPYTDNDTVSFDTSNIVTVGTNKNTVSIDIWTDNTTIKDACIAKRDQYTTVHVYYLNGTAWDV